MCIRDRVQSVPAAKRWEKIRHIFLNPEALETTLLIDATDEAEDKGMNLKKCGCFSCCILLVGFDVINKQILHVLFH